MTQPEDDPEFFNLPASPIEAVERNRRMAAAETAIRAIAKAWDEGWDAGNFYAIDDFNRGHKATNPYRTDVPRRSTK